MTVNSFDVTINNVDVLSLLRAVDAALSPVGLYAFMQGPVEMYMESRIEDRFMSEGDDVTGKWAPLAAATQAIRSSQGYGASGPINVRTGQLKDAVLLNDVVSIPGGAQMTIPASPPQGELAEKLEHAQNGGISQAGKPYPARPVLGLNWNDTAAVIALLNRYIAVGGGAFRVSP